MQSRRTRIAYLKRMLKRLEKEDLRIQGLISSGEIPTSIAERVLSGDQSYRHKLATELDELQRGKD